MQDPVWTNDNVMTLLQLVLYDDYLVLAAVVQLYKCNSVEWITGHGVLLFLYCVLHAVDWKAIVCV